MSFYQGRRFLPQRFRLVLSSILQASGLPFSDVLTEKEIGEAFDEEESWFAQEDGDVFTPSLTLWAFLSQVLHKEKQRSCLAAVSRVIVLLVALGREPGGQQQWRVLQGPRQAVRDGPPAVGDAPAPAAAKRRFPRIGT